MNIFNFILLILAHFVCGFSILTLFRLRAISLIQKVTLSALLGLGLASFLPMVLEMFHVAINKNTLGISLTLMAIIPLIFSIKPLIAELKAFKFSFNDIRLYDVIIVAVILHLLYVGSFKSYYFPPTPRDLNSGAEAMAEFTVREGRINNSLLQQDMHTTNNHQKPPSILGLQIIYKMYVQPFGQVWLMIVSHCFFLFYFFTMRREIHPIFAGIFTILTIAVPEMYAYIIMALFDFSNMAFVFIGFYFFYLYLRDEERRRNNLWMSSILFAIAVFFRVETLILIVFSCAVMIGYTYFRFKKINIKDWVIDSFILCIISVLTYAVSMELFIKKMLPTKFNTGENMTSNLGDISPFFDRMSDMITMLMFSTATDRYNSRMLYNETFNIFVLFVIIEIGFIVFSRKVKEKAMFWLSIFVLTFVFIGFVGYLLPLADLNNTTKRALFKLIPVIFIFAANTTVMQYLSDLISKWEGYFLPQTVPVQAVENKEVKANIAAKAKK